MVERSSPDTACQLLYDGECPMCSAFARFADAAEAGQLKKIDARQNGALRDAATRSGMNLDYGIVVEHGGKLYYGADAMTCLANRKSPGFLLSLLYLPFRSRIVARIVYPVLVRIRWLLLRLMGKSFIRNLPARGG